MLKKNNVIFYYGFSFIISLIVSGCLVKQEEQPLGKSTITASINGIVDTFSNVNAYQYMGFFASGTIPNYKIVLGLGNVALGSHRWGRPNGFDYYDSAATLNYLPTIPEYGGYTITNFDASYRLIEGSFSFAVIDTTKDTLKIQNGLFTLYYVEKD